MIRTALATIAILAVTLGLGFASDAVLAGQDKMSPDMVASVPPD
ncbi:MAG: hypothetical protein WBA25_17380 [Jannaschia sp.]